MKSTKRKKKCNNADATNLKNTKQRKKPVATTASKKRPANKHFSKRKRISERFPNSGIHGVPGRRHRLPRFMTADEIREEKNMELLAYLEYCDEQGGDLVKIGDNNQKLYRFY